MPEASLFLAVLRLPRAASLSLADALVYSSTRLARFRFATADEREQVVRRAFERRANLIQHVKTHPLRITLVQLPERRVGQPRILRELVHGHFPPFQHLPQTQPVISGFHIGNIAQEKIKGQF